MRSRVVKRKVTALLLGVGGAGAVTAVCFAISDIPSTIPALLLLVPIAVAGVLGGVVIAALVAAASAACYALAFLHPVGAVRVGLTEDVLVLCTFLAVGIGVAILSDRRGDDAEVLDDERAQLLRGVSHDLRNPLTTIRAVSSDLLDEDTYDPTTRTALLHMVIDESERMDRIVGNLLRASRPDSDVFTPEQSPHEVLELVDICCHRFNRHRGVLATVESDIEPSLPLVFVDSVQFDQVLSNVVDNARRAAPTGSIVTVAAKRADRDLVRITVSDTGPGFTRSELAHAFDPFRSGSASTGLGLSVSKAIVVAHGGTIAVHNGHDGGGCVDFTVPVVHGIPLSPAGNTTETHKREC